MTKTISQLRESQPRASSRLSSGHSDHVPTGAETRTGRSPADGGAGAMSKADIRVGFLKLRTRARELGDNVTDYKERQCGRD